MHSAKFTRHLAGRGGRKSRPDRGRRWRTAEPASGARIRRRGLDSRRRPARTERRHGVARVAMFDTYHQWRRRCDQPRGVTVDLPAGSGRLSAPSRRGPDAAPEALTEQYGSARQKASLQMLEELGHPSRELPIRRWQPCGRVSWRRYVNGSRISAAIGALRSTFPSGSVTYTHVSLAPAALVMVTTSPTGSPPAASTASRAAGTSSTTNAMCPKPGPLIAIGDFSSRRL